MHIKNFLGWIGVKQQLDAGVQGVPHVNPGEVWWASLGENVGFEINGKSELFTRPVLIFKKLAQGFYLVIPLTSQSRVGTWYVNFSLRGRAQTACLHQIRTIDYRRLYSKMGELLPLDYQDIKKAFANLYL